MDTAAAADREDLQGRLEEIDQQRQALQRRIELTRQTLAAPRPEERTPPMRLTVLPSGAVELEYSDGLTGARVQRLYTCPDRGGYVHEEYAGGWRQTCERLSSTGITLEASSREALPELIRREYKRMKANEKRRMQA
jgi:hypothetical protein